MQIEWLPVGSEEDAEAVVALLASKGLDIEGVDRVREAVLPFYPHLLFIEAGRPTPAAAEEEAGSAGAERLGPPSQEPQPAPEPSRENCYALIDIETEDVTVLDMTNQPIYELNRRRDFLLVHDTVVPYLAFFFSAVAGPLGLMPLIEKLDIAAEAEPNAEAREALAGLAGFVPPTVLSSRERDAFHVHAALLFQGAVFKVLAEVEARSGIVTISQFGVALAAGDEEGESGDGDGAEGETGEVA